MSAGNIAAASFSLAGTWVQYYSRDCVRLYDPPQRRWASIRVPHDRVSDVVLDIYRTGPQSASQIAYELIDALKANEKIGKVWDLDKVKLTANKGTAVNLRLIWRTSKDGIPLNPLGTNAVGDLLAEACNEYALGKQANPAPVDDPAPRPPAPPDVPQQPSPQASPNGDSPPEAPNLAGLRKEYEQLTGNKPDGRWRQSRLEQEIESALHGARQ